MRKIPTIYVRDFGPESKGRYVTEKRNPECAWVFEGEGHPTRKYDGTCVMFDGALWWMRREVKEGTEFPADYIVLGTDPVTCKTIGWSPAKNSSFYKYLLEVLDPSRRFGIMDEYMMREPRPGTYELVGPRINGNPEQIDKHLLIRHGYRASVDYVAMETGLMVSAVAFGEHYDIHRRFLLERPGWEGIVWHHPDGRMAKIKGRDFRK